MIRVGNQAAARQRSREDSGESSDWMELMKRGDFAAALSVSDGVVAAGERRDWSLPRHQQAIWTGAPLAGKRVLVRCYHGLGDTLQFIRYVPLLSRIARQVTVWIQPALIDFLADTPGLGRLMPLHDGTPDTEYDVDVEIMELPHVFRTVEASIPGEVPYLRCTAAHALSDDECRVGLLWRAGGWDPRRSIPLATVSPILEVPGVQFTPMQEALTAEETLRFRHASAVNTIPTLASQVMAQHLVITVDTMLAHLAGSLGVPTWLLLHADPDWRWMRERADTPWYPTIRLYRQPAADDWRTVVCSVRDQLVRFAGGHDQSGGAGNNTRASVPLSLR